mgnify:CR=1 FL=1
MIETLLVIAVMGIGEIKEVKIIRMPDLLTCTAVRDSLATPKKRIDCVKAEVPKPLPNPRRF